ncbi:YfgM family protein [Pasteurella sp. PK-2025]|uniref:YfgM family protein n=1 Tax=unclassified Pasteurella TaxID=2621516 RepID=UPI003C772F13
MAYTIEEEQELNQLKAWWSENHKTVIASVVLAFAAIFAWNYWKSYQLVKNQQASAAYEHLIYTTRDDLTERNKQIESFIKENSNDAYATLALLDKAKFEVEKQLYALAEKTLKQAISRAPDEILVSIAALRLASVQYQQHDFNAALDSLKQVKSTAWDSKKYHLMGDIFLAKGDMANAKINYEKAQQNASPLEAQWLQVRLNNL